MQAVFLRDNLVPQFIFFIYFLELQPSFMQTLIPFGLLPLSYPSLLVNLFSWLVKLLFIIGIDLTHSRARAHYDIIRLLELVKELHSELYDITVSQDQYVGLSCPFYSEGFLDMATAFCPWQMVQGSKHFEVTHGQNFFFFGAKNS